MSMTCKFFLAHCPIVRIAQSVFYTPTLYSRADLFNRTQSQFLWENTTLTYTCVTPGLTQSHVKTHRFCQRYGPTNCTIQLCNVNAWAVLKTLCLRKPVWLKDGHTVRRQQRIFIRPAGRHIVILTRISGRRLSYNRPSVLSKLSTCSSSNSQTFNDATL